QEVAGGQRGIRLARRGRAEAGAGARRLGGGDVGLGEGGGVAAGQRVALAHREDRRVGRLGGRQGGEHGARRLVLAGAEQRVGAAQRQAERARRVGLLRLPALDQVGELVVLAEPLGQVGQVGDDERLGRRERRGLLQVAPGAL